MLNAQPRKIAAVLRAVLLVGALVTAAAANAQETALAKMNRGALRVRCEITADGGAMQLAARDPADAQTRAAIGDYARALVEKIPTGHFELLGVLVPARPELTRPRAGGGIACSAAPEGGSGGVSVRFVASDLQTRIWVHEFLTAAGDSVEKIGGRGADHPGNNLGWDAQKDPSLSK